MIKPWLILPPAWAHKMAPLALPIFSHLAGDKESPMWRSFNWKGLYFRNPLGIAGGVDKNAENLNAWWRLGVGFVEVGTVTPKPQNPNPGKIIDRDIKQHSLWNKMGFPSEGADEVFENLQSYEPRLTPVFVNIGKNRQTPNENAVEDYLFLVRRMYEVSDAFVVNVSSPNTKGLRDLQNRIFLENLIKSIKSEVSLQALSKPILLKLSPDLSDGELEMAIGTSLEQGIDGFILTNTTLQRPANCHFPNEGGLSGRPLNEISKKILIQSRRIIEAYRKDTLLVSVGGITTADDVKQRLDLGAHLIQLYTALVYEGPGVFLKITKQGRNLFS